MQLPEKWVNCVWVRNPDDPEQVARLEVGDVVEFPTPCGRIGTRIAAFWNVSVDPETDDEDWFINADPIATFAVLHTEEGGSEHDLPLAALLTYGQRKRCLLSVFKGAL